MSCLAHRRFFRVHALLLCMLWLVGFEVGPGLHVALHSEIGHHHHGPVASAQEHAEPNAPEHESAAHDAHEHEPAHHEHHHGDEAHESSHHDHGEPAQHAHDAPEPDPASSDEHDRSALLSDSEYETAVARRAHDLDHGAHALAHRGIAASPTPPAWPPVAVAPWVYLSRASFALDPIRSRGPKRARARGPPGLS